MPLPRPHDEREYPDRRGETEQRVAQRRAEPPAAAADGTEGVIRQPQSRPGHESRGGLGGLQRDRQLHQENSLLHRLPEGALSS